MPKNSKGFSPMGVVLILVAVGLVGFTGWFVYRATKNTNASLTAAQRSNESSAAAGAHAQSQSDAGTSAPTTDMDSAIARASDPTPTTDSDSSSAPVASNGSILTIDKVSVDIPTYYGSPGTTEYKRVSLTIHNNTSSQQSYDVGGIRGVTSTKEVVDPMNNLPGSSEWQSTNIAAGGEAKVSVLFKKDQDLVLIQWKAQSNTDTLYYVVQR